MRKNRLFLLLLLMVTSVSAIMAQQVSVDEALSRAKTFLQTSSAGSVSSSKGQVAASLQLKLAYTCQSDDNQKTCFYVFNRGNNGGFIIMGGDETAQEVLGYSDNGSFDYATVPENFKWWLSQYKQQITSAISYAEANPEDVAVAKSKAKAARKTEANTRNNIGPLISTKWAQSSPYYNAIITASGKEYLTGCVATAMAQVMKYHQCPTTGKGSHSYTCTTNSDFSPSVNFGNTTYDWTNMIDDYRGSYTTDQANAVATLMYHCGVSVDMDYDTSANGGSGASITNVPVGLYNYFGYDKGMVYEERMCYSDEEWENMVYNELANSRPVIYGGQATKSGHCFICDGYDANATAYCFHFNWGWGSSYDGWYAITGTGALQPKSAAYTGSQEIVTGVKANCGGSEIVNFIANSDGVFIKESTSSTDKLTTYSYDGSTGSKIIYINTSFYNYCLTNTVFDFGIKAIGNNGNVVYWTVLGNKSFKHNYGYNGYDMAIDLSKITANDTYTIVPVVRLAGGTDNDWVNIKLSAEHTAPTITVTNAASNPTAQFTKAPYFNNDNNPYCDDTKFYYSIYNPESKTFQTFYATIFPIGGNTGWIYSLSPNIASGKTGSGYFNLSSLKSNLTEGTKYSMSFYKNYNSGTCSDPMNVEAITFTYRAKLDHEYTLTSAGIGTLILPFDAAIPTKDNSSSAISWKAYECKSLDGNTLVLNEVTTLKRNTPYIIEGTAGTYTFTGPKAIDDSPVLFGTNGALVGTMLNDAYQFQSGDYILQNQSGNTAFYKYASTDWKATPFRAFIKTSSNALYSSIVFPDNGTTTAISAPMTSTVAAGIYSIGGTKLSQLQPGLNIIVDENGVTRKVFIKNK